MHKKPFLERSETPVLYSGGTVPKLLTKFKMTYLVSILFLPLHYVIYFTSSHCMFSSAPSCFCTLCHNQAKNSTTWVKPADVSLATSALFSN